MVSLQPPVCDFNLPIINFSLPDTQGKIWTQTTAAGENGLLVMFICNHCPYVRAILDKIIKDTKELKTLGINSVAIMSNDISEYPEDSLENMQKITQNNNFSFPYLLDADQQIAKNFGAVCTPDFFGYNADLKLQYRGRLDESRKQSTDDNVRRDLFLAMAYIAKTGIGPKKQISSMGCSIKWVKE